LKVCPDNYQFNPNSVVKDQKGESMFGSNNGWLPMIRHWKSPVNTSCG